MRVSERFPKIVPFEIYRDLSAPAVPAVTVEALFASVWEAPKGHGDHTS
jgi:hypothetical protein